MNILIPAIVFAVAVLLFAVMPSRMKRERYEALAGRFYANGGLYDNNGVPENSLAAFRLAVEKGYGSKLDVQFTSDKRLIVFRDDDYGRMCGDHRRVRDVPFSEASRMLLLHSGEKIPQLGEVLHLVDGMQPLIIEIRTCGSTRKWIGEICMETLSQLREYGGAYCVGGTGPYVAGWFWRHAHDIVRGQLMRGIDDSGRRRNHCLLNFIGRPHFIAMDRTNRVFWQKLMRILGAMTVLFSLATLQESEELIDRKSVV